MPERDQVPYIVVERDSAGLGAFFLGALLGAGVALLFAPRSGEETQQEIKERMTRLRDAADQRVREARQNLEEKLEHARDEVVERVGAVREAVESGKQAAAEAKVEIEGRLERTKAAYRAGVDAARDVSREEPEGA